MKRWCLIPKQIPRPSDTAELLASGCHIVETLFGGMVLIVESEEDLAYTLDPEMWDVSIDEKGASA
jgi:hypothetical protein